MDRLFDTRSKPRRFLDEIAEEEAREKNTIPKVKKAIQKHKKHKKRDDPIHFTETGKVRYRDPKGSKVRKPKAKTSA